jgi:hypothetical protein
VLKLDPTVIDPVGLLDDSACDLRDTDKLVIVGGRAGLRVHLGMKGSDYVYY